MPTSVQMRGEWIYLALEEDKASFSLSFLITIPSNLGALKTLF